MKCRELPRTTEPKAATLEHYAKRLPPFALGAFRDKMSKSASDRRHDMIRRHDGRKISKLRQE
jgi:hypothetical protein